MEVWLALLLIVVVALIILYFIDKLGLDAQLQMIIRVAVVGIVIIVLIWKFLLPALGL